MNDVKLMYFIDDDFDDLELLHEISAALGHRSYIFSDGPQMLHQLAQQESMPDIIFLDLSMPKNDGYEILEILRGNSRYDTIPIVIHSSNCDEKCIARCLELGANFYITKSTSIKGIRSALQHAINKDWTIMPTKTDFLHVHEG